VTAYLFPRRSPATPRSSLHNRSATRTRICVVGLGISIRYLKLGQTSLVPQNNDSHRENDVENGK
jgi:hypothetical protein